MKGVGDRVTINSCVEHWMLVGQIGTITERSGGELTVRLDNGRTIQIDENYVH